MAERFPGSYSGLTVKQAELLSFIRSEDAEGRTPSYNEMGRAVGVVKSGIHRLIGALAERGYITRAYHSQRSIRLTSPADGNISTVPIEALLAELKRRGVVLATAS